METPRTPCRLFVYLAKDAPIAVVLRRGPSDWVRLSLWNTADDTVKHGQRIDRTNDWPDRTVWLNRLLRDGWTLVEGAKRETWQRNQPDGDLVLLMSWPADPHAAMNQPLTVEYAVLREPDGELISIGVASWADWDQQGRLVMARDGRLFDWTLSGGLREIADFNPQEPDPEPSPPEAQVW